MKFPALEFEKLIIFNQKSNIAICCLWSNPDTIADEINIEKIVCIGQLKTLQGIDYLLYNVGMSERITDIIVTGRNINNIKELLQNKTKNSTYLDSLKANEFTKHVIIHYSDVDDINSYIDMHYNPEKKKPITQYKLPDPIQIKDKTPIQPGFALYGMNAWNILLDHILEFGHKRGNTIEINNVSVTLGAKFFSTPEILESKRKYPKIMELLYSPKYYDSSRHELSYTYPDRIAKYDQIKKVISILREDIYSRKAYISLWDIDTDGTTESPCLTAIQLLENKDYIDIYANFRSNDAYSAFLYNALALRGLQEYICKELNVGVGVVSINTISSHIYNDCVALASEQYEKYKGRFCFGKTCVYLRKNNGEYKADIYGWDEPSGEITPIKTITEKYREYLEDKVLKYIFNPNHTKYIISQLDEIDNKERKNEIS